ncbi:1219_t:CDS:1, partial [Paraglomus occultum]
NEVSAVCKKFGKTIKKILSGVEDNKHHQKRHHGIFHNIPPAPPLSRRLDDDF